jgi:hypothetical protein
VLPKWHQNSVINQLLKFSGNGPIYQTRQALTDEYHSKLTDANRGTVAYPTLPSFPASTDIIAKAEELKKFVDAA